MDSSVNDRVAEIRFETKMSKKDFADYLGVSATVIGDIENGKIEPSKNLLLNVARKYAVSLNWLYLGVGEKSLVTAINTVPKEHPVIQALESMVMEKTNQYSIALTQIHERFEKVDERLSSVESQLRGKKSEA
ncbi:MAG: hypothetical protein Ta2A_19840 [Treponemataceae bacterium]|nr:MAG: hypothetical protein Ta2A_19840 [Treponemataceae bacterium]